MDGWTGRWRPRSRSRPRPHDIPCLGDDRQPTRAKAHHPRPTEQSDAPPLQLGPLLPPFTPSFSERTNPLEIELVPKNQLGLGRCFSNNNFKRSTIKSG